VKSRFRLVLALAAVAFAGGLAVSSPPVACADDVDVDVSLFFGALEPYGEWVNVDTYGYVWVPEDVDYAWRPYYLGHWEWIDGLGWTWVSEEPFGWATYHYGRWVYLDLYGWSWIPGSVWSPAWVEFRYGGGYIGWTPIGPSAGWRIDLGPVDAYLTFGPYAWTFVPVRWFTAPVLTTYYVSPVYSPWLVTAATTTYRPADISGRVVLNGVEPAVIEKETGTKVARRKLKAVESADAAGKARVEGDSVVLYRPKVAPRAPKAAPKPTTRMPEGGLDAWTKRRQEALERHIDGQRKALDKGEFPQPAPAPGMTDRPAPPKEDVEARRKQAQEQLEKERARLQKLLEEQRRRMQERQTRGQNPPPKPPPPPAMDDQPGMGHGKGMDEDEDNGMK
jgi:hypothetical protein